MHTNTLRMSRALEDRFFFEQNQILSEQHARLKQEKESAEALSRVSGITDQAVLKELVAHNIRPETLVALSLIPIIEVAWADGKIDPEEEKAILNGLKESGLDENKALVLEWLRTRPDAKFMETWKTYMRGLAKEIKNTAMYVIEAGMLQRAYNVAEASGKFLGLFNPISNAERVLLKDIEQFFKELGSTTESTNESLHTTGV